VVRKEGKTVAEWSGLRTRGAACSLAAGLASALAGCAFFAPRPTEESFRERMVVAPAPRAASGSATEKPSAPPRTVGELRAVPPPARAISLSEAVEFAHQLSPRLRAVEQRVARARGDRTVAFAGFLPEVWAVYRHIEGTEEFSLPTIPTEVGNVAYGGEADRFRQAELGIQWLVWDFGRTPGRYGQAEAAADIAALQFDRAKQTVAFEVADAYYALLRARAERAIAAEAVRDAESILRDSRNFLEYGDALEEGVLRADVQLARMQLALVRARADEAIARAALNRSIGFQIGAPIEIVDAQSEPSFDRPLEECMDLAVDHRDELRVALRAIDSSQLGVGAAQAAFFPRVVVGGTGIHVDRDGPPIEENVFTGGVRLELALFDGGRRVGELQGATADAQEAIARAEQICDAVAYEVVAAHVRIEECRERIRLGRTAVSHARETLRVETNRFKSGDATPTDMVDAELALVRSQQDYYDALYDYQLALARLEYATGTSLAIGGTP